MGEITEALRRAGGARRQRRARRGAEFPPPEAPPAAEPAGDEGDGGTRGAETDAAAEPRQRGVPIAERLGRAPVAPPPREPAAEPPGLVLSRERVGNWTARAVLVQDHGGSSESYRHFAIQVLRALEARGERSVLIASALREEGKTTTACNLAFALASMAGGRRHALVDLDLRRPNVAPSLGLRVRTGIESVLAGEAELDAVCIETARPPLDIYPVRAPTPNAHEVLARPALRELVETLLQRYEVVVFDSAPVLLVPDTELVLPHVGGCIAISRSRRTRRAAFKQMIERIPAAKLLGVFLNEARAPRHGKEYGYYYAGDPESERGET
jgi:capsular exopolysaccharide synthesis family protein